MNMEMATLEICDCHIINMDYLSFYNKLTNEISRLQSFRTYVQVFLLRNNLKQNRKLTFIENDVGVLASK